MANEQQYLENCQKIREMGLLPEKEAELLIEAFQDYRLWKNDIERKLFGNRQRLLPKNQPPDGDDSLPANN
ncbi:hypothetical protein D3C87_2151810 [compost metagenome]